MFEQPWLGLLVLVGGLAFFAAVVAVCVFVSPWLFFVACGLAVVWMVIDGYRWRAHRVDPYDELARRHGLLDDEEASDD